MWDMCSWRIGHEVWMGKNKKSMYEHWGWSESGLCGGKMGEGNSRSEK